MDNYLLTNGVIVTMDANRRVLVGYSLLVKDGVIAAIEPASQFLDIGDVKVMDCAGCAIVPGFIDCGGWAGARPFSGWMQEYPAKRMQAIASVLANADEAWWRAEGAVMAGSRLRSGVTTGCVHYHADFFSDGRYVVAVRAHLNGYSGVGGTVAPVVEPKLLETIAAIGYTPKIYLPALIASHPWRVTDSFEGLTRRDLIRIREATRASKRFRAGITAGVWGRNIELMEQAGVDLSGVEWLFQFCNGLTYDEVKRLKVLDAAIAHLPQQTACYAPFAEMMEIGLRCAVMCEGVNSGCNGDMLQAVRQVQLIEQLRFDDLYYLPGGRQLELITIDAARALGIEDKKGSLETGKDADITVVDLEYPRTVPWEDMPVHRLMIDANDRQVRDVITGGILAVTGGRLIGDDKLRMEAGILTQQFKSLLTDTDDSWNRPVKSWPEGRLINEAGG
ncbi:MAG: amidohydrolase family protein [Oscillospiraceae bacterium]|nr:amidohydrolase family protein [Oscillospiraceae bacterium]